MEVIHTESDSLLRHVVIFKYTAETTDEKALEISKAFEDLQNAIPEIKDFEWGINDSPEDHHQGFTHCYVLTFESEKDRDEVYTPHPAHRGFQQLLHPHMEKVFVVDYWTK